jgi:hypothetical protein
LIRVGGRRLCLLHSIHTSSVVNPAYCPLDSGGPFPAGEEGRHITDCSPPSSVLVLVLFLPLNNTIIHTSTIRSAVKPIYLHVRPQPSCTSLPIRWQMLCMPEFWITSTHDATQLSVALITIANIYMLTEDVLCQSWYFFAAYVGC